MLGLDTMLDLQQENDMGSLGDSEDFDFQTFSNLGVAMSATSVGKHQDLTQLENPASALSGDTSVTQFPTLAPSSLQMQRPEDGAGPHSSEPRISPSCQCTQDVLGSTSKLMWLRNHGVLVAGGAHRADKGVHRSCEEIHDANKVIVRFAMCEKPHSISESMMALSLLQLVGEKLVDEGFDTPCDSESDGPNHSSARIERNSHDTHYEILWTLGSICNFSSLVLHNLNSDLRTW
ncbi:hypothetical protein DHEL01_v211372 [Diaporthe helianthi]|uniref:Uncharacterized protein n=1 Tax=Diaporthe helianthi TaxID=158607 RepID=A0A2P5HJ28_DIAHE|nr:hypothetical protein DHEL01_v211372 [Diaporthe helianthi]